MPDSEAVYPLLHAGNSSDGKLEHPKNLGKARWYRADDEKPTRQLTQPGAYVVVKRFSSKEKKRRVTAFPLVLKPGCS